MKNDNGRVLELEQYIIFNEPTVFTTDELGEQINRKGYSVFIKANNGFSKYLEDFYIEKNIHQLLISKKYFKEMLLDCFAEIKKDNSIVVDIASRIKDVEKQDYHVLLPLYYVYIRDSILKFGEYNLVQYQNIQEYAKTINTFNFYSYDKILEDKYFYSVPFLDVVISAREQEYAMERAREKTEEFINLLNFMLFRWYRGAEVISSSSDIGSKNRHYIFSEKNIISNVSISPENVKRIDISDFKDYIFDKASGNERLVDIFCKGDCSELEIRIKNAVSWIGLATAEKNDAIAFVQAVFAVECLLQVDVKGEPISKSIVASIAEQIAFLLGNSFDERKKYEKDFKRLYGLRSKISHGKSMDISAFDVLEIVNIASKIIFTLLTNPSFKDAKTLMAVNNYVERLKYKVITDKEDE